MKNSVFYLARLSFISHGVTVCCWVLVGSVGSRACTLGLFLAIVQGDVFRAERENVPKTNKTAKRGRAPFSKDKRRRHHHFLVTVSYADGEKFGRVYTDKDKATRFAERQRRSPVVKAVRVSQVS